MLWTNKAGSAANIETRAASRFLCILLIAATVPALVAAGVNFYFDPLQFFRQSSHPRFALTMMRHQMPGVIRNYPFDAAALGNSLDANFRSDMFREANPPIHFQNLSMAGSTLNEVTLVADLALRKKKLTTLFWAIGYQGTTGYRYPDFPHCLYSRIFQYLPYCYLLNLDILRESASLVDGHADLTRAEWAPQVDGWQTYGYLPIDLHGHACMMQQWVGSRARISEQTQVALGKLDPADSEEARDFAKMVFPIVDSHPQVHFVFFFAPVFFTEFWREASGGAVSSHAFIEAELLKRPNVKIFDFQEDAEVTHDPQFYRDLYHGSSDVAARMAHWITSDTGTFQVTNLEDNKRRLASEVLAAADKIDSYFDENCSDKR